MKIDLSKEAMLEAFLQYLEEIFRLPEIISACVRDITVGRDDLCDTGRRAFDAGYHDLYSDIDLKVKVCLPRDGSVTPDQYMLRTDRFGVTEETALGYFFVPENRMYRIVFRNGMRYDFGFEFEYSLDAALPFDGQPDTEKGDPDWPPKNTNRFWFIQVQALGRLYRRDHLISAHLANMNCNDTLVMQMILRDRAHGTRHHRYGYSEEPEYTKYLGKAPYRTDDPTFCRIADHLCAAALACDRLAGHFDPGYRKRSDEFFALWDCYHIPRAVPQHAVESDRIL